MSKEVSVTDKSVAYVTYNAFTHSPDGGNPAAVVLLSPSSITVDADKPDGSVDWHWNGSETFLRDVAAHIDYPMTAFVVPQQSGPGAEKGRADYLLKWYSPAGEAPICGHATVALSQHLLSTNPDLEELHLRTKFYGTVITRRATDPLNPATEGANALLVAIDFPELSGLEKIESTLGSRQKWVNIMNEVDGAAAEGAQGDSRFRREDVLETWMNDEYLLIEMDEGVDIGKIKMDCRKLSYFAPRKVLLTQVALFDEDGPAWNEIPHIYTRVLGTTPGFEVEDAATGSAHCLIVPHFLSNPSTFNRLTSIYPHFDEDGAEARIVRVKQKSERGGEMLVRWDKEGKRITIFGGAVRTGEGEAPISGQ